jgi:hypothetical protein
MIKPNFMPECRRLHSAMKLDKALVAACWSQNRPGTWAPFE